jgi:hypothetical protein
MNRSNILLRIGALACLCTALSQSPALAQESTPAPTPAPPPYVLPFQLRPAIAPNVVRLDFPLAMYGRQSDTIAGGLTIAPTIVASYRVLPWLAPLVRLGMFSNSPTDGASGTGFDNPLIGVLATPNAGNGFRPSFYAAFTIPVGSGGGDAPDAGVAAATGRGRAARSYLDNALMLPNYFAAVQGVGLAYLRNGFTIQAEATVLEFVRVRGPAATQNSSIVNSTWDLWLAYSIMPQLSVGIELRHQRFLSTPLAVSANHALREQTTIAVGVRTKIALGSGIVMPLGIAYIRGIDEPMQGSGASYNTIWIDVPVLFP